MLRGTTLVHPVFAERDLTERQHAPVLYRALPSRLKTIRPRGSETMFGRTTGTPFHLTELSEAAE